MSYSYSGDPIEFLQQVLDVEANETNIDKRVINVAKCDVITFNILGKNVCPQVLSINGIPMQQCDKIKLQGVKLSEYLKWSENTSHICKKVNKKFFILSKLKQFG